MPRARIAFLGWPSLSHSSTPAGLERMLRAAGLDGECVAIAVPPEDLPARLDALERDGFLGANLTLPLKERALACVAAPDAWAARSGAVNGVAFGPGARRGTNADLPGLADTLDHDVGDIRGASVAVLGAGGAARAAALACLDRGAREVRVFCRDVAGGERMREDLERRAGRGLPLAVEPLARASFALPTARLCVQATPLGLRPDDPLPVDLDGDVAPDLVVMDLIYRPARTPLLEAARRRGLRALNGWPMWVHQAAHLFAFLTGRPAPHTFRCDAPPPAGE